MTSAMSAAAIFSDLIVDAVMTSDVRLYIRRVVSSDPTYGQVLAEELVKMGKLLKTTLLSIDVASAKQVLDVIGQLNIKAIYASRPVETFDGPRIQRMVTACRTGAFAKHNAEINLFVHYELSDLIHRKHPDDLVQARLEMLIAVKTKQILYAATNTVLAGA